MILHSAGPMEGRLVRLRHLGGARRLRSPDRAPRVTSPPPGWPAPLRRPRG